MQPKGQAEGENQQPDLSSQPPSQGRCLALRQAIQAGMARAAAISSSFQYSRIHGRCRY